MKRSLALDLAEGEAVKAGAVAGPSPSQTDQPSVRKRLNPGPGLSIKERVGICFANIGRACAGIYAIGNELVDAPILAIEMKKNDERLSFPIPEALVKDLVDGLGDHQKSKNTLEFDPHNFTILNPVWDQFLKNKLVGMIKAQLDIEPHFTANLDKLIIYKPGSFIKRHKDSDKEDGMFGTLIVQLPSIYEGGQLVIYHGNKSKTIDLSSAQPNISNGFKTHFAAFYANCEYEMLPIEKGIRVCLIYNLVVSGSTKPPPMALLPQPCEEEFISLITEWKRDEPYEFKKLIYGLSNNYTEDNLCFETLESNDKSVAVMLKKLSGEVGVRCFLAVLKKQSHIQGYRDKQGQENSDGEESDFVTRTYSLEHNVQIYDTRETNPGSSCGPNLKLKIGVDFENEVITQKSFKNIKPSKVERMVTANKAIEKDIFYQRPVIVIYSTDNIFEISLFANAPYEILEHVFLHQYIPFQHQFHPDMILRRAKDMAKYGSESLFEVVTQLDDLELTKIYLDNYKLGNLESVKKIIGLCETFGWDALSESLQKVFGTAIGIVTTCPEILKLQALDTLVGEQPLAVLDVSRKKICTELLKQIMNLEGKKPHSANVCAYKLSFSTPSFTELESKLNNDFLSAIFRIGKKLDADLNDFACNQPIKFMVPVLLHQFQSEPGNESSATKCEFDNCLVKIGKHMLESMHHILIKPENLPTSTWGRKDFPTCTFLCFDCIDVRNFMESEERELRLKINKARRNHLQTKLDGLKGVTHLTEHIGSPKCLLIKKTEKAITEKKDRMVDFCKIHFDEFKSALELFCGRGKKPPANEIQTNTVD